MIYCPWFTINAHFDLRRLKQSILRWLLYSISCLSYYSWYPDDQSVYSPFVERGHFPAFVFLHLYLIFPLCYD